MRKQADYELNVAQAMRCHRRAVGSSDEGHGPRIAVKKLAASPSQKHPLLHSYVRGTRYSRRRTASRTHRIFSYCIDNLERVIPVGRRTGPSQPGENEAGEKIDTVAPGPALDR
jgi:hypothetical protein